MTNPFFFSINLFFFKFNHMEKGKLQIFELKKKTPDLSKWNFFCYVKHLF